MILSECGHTLMHDPCIGDRNLDSDVISNLEMKYMKLIQSIDAMIVDLANQKEDFETQIKEMNTKKKTRQDQVNSEWER